MKKLSFNNKNYFIILLITYLTILSNNGYSQLSGSVRNYPSTDYNNLSICIDNNNNEANGSFRIGWNADGYDGSGNPKTNWVEKFTLLENGNVGIGTTSPSAKLHVNGGGGGTMDITTNGRIWSGQNSTAGGIWVNSISGSPTQFFGTLDNTSKMGLYNNGDWRFIIDNTGNVGIGTTTPTAKLHVNGGSITVENGPRKISLEPADPAGNVSARLGTSSNHGLKFMTNNTPRMKIGTDGSVLIGTDFARFNNISTTKKASFSLWVEKGVVATDFAVTAPSTWADFVFADDYQLRPLREVAAFIQANKHLPDMPSEKVVKKEGYTVHEMTTKLLQKVEELTLYTIGQDQKINEQAAQIKALTDQLTEIKAMLQSKK